MDTPDITNDSASKMNTCAIVSFVTGLVSIVFALMSWLAIIGVAAGIVSIVFYVKANKEIKVTGQDGHGFAVAGLVCGIAGLVAGLIVFACSIAILLLHSTL